LQIRVRPGRFILILAMAAIVDVDVDGRWIADIIVGLGHRHWLEETLLLKSPPKERAVFAEINKEFDPDSRRFAVAYANGSIGLFELPSGKLLQRFAADPSVTCLAFNPKGGQSAVWH
jgi:hypothetical protein